MSRTRTLKSLALPILAALTIGSTHAQTSGTIYWSRTNGSQGAGTATQLYKRNPLTGVNAPVGGIVNVGYNGIGYYNGSLFGVTTLAGAVIKIDTATGNYTPTGAQLPAGNNYASGDVANGILYTTNMNGATTNRRLYKINLATNALTSLPFGLPIADLVYYNGYLYGMDGTSQIYRIDPNTGAGTAIPGAVFAGGSGPAIWGDGTGIIYFPGKGTFNANTNQVVIGNVSSIDTQTGLDYDGTWSSMNNVTPLTNGGTIAADQNNCGVFDPAPIISMTDAAGGDGAPIEYRWLADGVVISGATGSTYDPGSITATTNYQREARRGNTAWVASNMVTMTVNVSPDVSITESGGTAQCYGDSLMLTAIGAASYSWNTGATTAGINVRPAATTTYTVTGTSSEGCTATASVTVEAAFAPEIAASITSSDLDRVCEGTLVTLTASGGDTYIWSDGVTGATRTVAATPGNDVYTVVVGRSGCPETATTSITVYGKGCNDLNFTAGVMKVNNEAADLTLYPNPSKDYVNIDTKNQVIMEQVVVMNHLGATVYSQRADNGQKHLISVANFAPGIYIMKVLTNKGNIIREFEVLK